AMDYDVTRAGMIYILISVVIGIAAINTGNNLLYVVVAALLSAILVSGIASALVLRSLTLDVHLPEHVFAARPMLARLLLRNASSWLPSFSVRVVPAKRKNNDKERCGWETPTSPRPPEPVAPPPRPPPAPRARGGRKAHPARIRLFPFSRSRTGTARRLGDQLPDPRPLLRKKLRPGHALSLFLPDEDPAHKPGPRSDRLSRRRAHRSVPRSSSHGHRRVRNVCQRPRQRSLPHPG